MIKVFDVLKVRDKSEWKVMIDKRIVGKIVYENLFFQYFAKGSYTGGERFEKLSDCINSLNG